jgi:hypothetical protein
MSGVSRSPRKSERNGTPFSSPRCRASESYHCIVHFAGWRFIHSASVGTLLFLWTVHARAFFRSIDRRALFCNCASTTLVRPPFLSSCRSSRLESIRLVCFKDSKSRRRLKVEPFLPTAAPPPSSPRRRSADVTPVRPRLLKHFQNSPYKSRYQRNFSKAQTSTNFQRLWFSSLFQNSHHKNQFPT